MLEPRTMRITFPGDIADALIDVSLDEHRHPADQVVVLVRDALRQSGALTDTRSLVITGIKPASAAVAR
jgi:hypothetical protein